MSSLTRQQLENWLKTKTLSGKVLDIGGSQNPINGRIANAGVEEFVILDLAEPHENKKPADFVQDLNLPLESLKYQNYFDFAVCGEVTEYLYNPIVALESIAFMLKTGGRLLISFHFYYPVHNPVNADMLRYTRAGAVKLLEVAGFEVVEITPRKSTRGGFQGIWMKEQMRPARGYDFHDDVGVLIEAKKK